MPRTHDATEKELEQKETQTTQAAGMLAPVEEDGSDVERTLDDLREASRPQKPPPKRTAAEYARKIAVVLFFPFYLIGLGVRKMLRRLNLPLTAKMTVVYASIFFLVLTISAVFIVATLRSAAVDRSYVRTLIVMCVVLIPVISALYAAMIWVTAQFMLKPIRTITARVDEITDANLSARLDPVDSQDELRELVRQINEMLDKLEESFRRQQNFVADAGHELKTPIAVIQGYADMLGRWGKSDPAVLDEAIEAIGRESEHMQKLVEQLLKLARLGDFSVSVTRFNLAEVAADITDGYIVVDGGAHEISYECAETDVPVETDKNLLTEAVRVLADNAVKYTPAGGRITVRCGTDEDGVWLSVTDTGVGIKSEDLPHICERFYRCDKARGRESGSLGLGLSLCKGIMDGLGGEIEVKSDVGLGSCFTLRFPVGK